MKALTKLIRFVYGKVAKRDPAKALELAVADLNDTLSGIATAREEISARIVEDEYDMRQIEYRITEARAAEERAERIANKIKDILE